jgi:Protein of unknown function (DUF3455)
MKRRFAAGLAAVVAATAAILTASGAAAATPDVATAGAPDTSANSKLPAAIQVDETQFKVVASFVGIGKQVYDCNTTGTAFTFREPVAGLLSRGVQAAIHGKGPFWASFDGSRVDGAPAGSAPSPDPTKNIPWLKVAGTPVGNTTGIFSNVKFIQRLDTRGGVAPAGSCTAPKTVAVDYTANYVFWAPK